MMQQPNEFLESFLREDLLPAGSGLVVAVSGGGDSMALLDLLRRHASEHAWRLLVAHVNHGLRGQESDADEALVREYCEQHGLPLEVRRLAPPAAVRGIEAWGRRERLAFFADLSQRNPGCRVVLAHHARDLVETLLMHLLRGCGPAGLVGMRPCIELGGAVLVRPLLYCTLDLKQYCRQHGVPFREDKSNRDLSLLRNRIRHGLIPVFVEACGPDFLARWVEHARTFAVEEDGWRRQLEPLLQQHPTVAELLAMARPLRLRFLYEILRRQADWPDHRRVLLALADKLEDAQPQWSLSVGGGWSFVRRYDQWSLVRRTLPPAAHWERTDAGWREAETGWAVSVRHEDLSDVHAPHALTAYAAPGDWEHGLWVRARRTGDRLRVLGGGTRKLKDLLIEARIPLEERAVWPVVECAEGILWVPGVARSDLHLLPTGGGPAVVLTATPGELKR